MKKLFAVIAAILIMQISAYANEPAVLLYHNIGEAYHQSQGDLHISPALFENHIAAFIENGYNIISIKQYADSLNGGAPIPEKSMIITFDDGYLSNYTYAYPILKRYGVCGTVFVVTSRVGSYDTHYPHFTWAQAREMVTSGVMTIYSHTDSDANIKALTADEVTYEMRKSKYLIEKNLGTNCNIAAAPGGMFSAISTKVIADSGYSLLCRVGDICIEENTDELPTLHRYTIHGDMSADDVMQMINQGE